MLLLTLLSSQPSAAKAPADFSAMMDKHQSYTALPSGLTKGAPHIRDLFSQEPPQGTSSNNVDDTIDTLPPYADNILELNKIFDQEIQQGKRPSWQLLLDHIAEDEELYIAFHRFIKKQIGGKQINQYKLSRRFEFCLEHGFRCNPTVMHQKNPDNKDYKKYLIHTPVQQKKISKSSLEKDFNLHPSLLPYLPDTITVHILQGQHPNVRGQCILDYICINPQSPNWKSSLANELIHYIRNGH